MTETMARPRSGLVLHEWLWLILIATLPVAWPFTVWIGGMAATATDLIFVAAVLAWGHAVLTRRAAIRWSPLYVPLAAYFATMLVSIPGSAEPARSLVKLAVETYLLGLTVLTVNLVTSTESVRRAMSAWLLGATATVVAGLTGIVLFYAGLTTPAVNPFLSNYGSLPPGNYPRLVALFANPNVLCTFLVISAVFVLTARALGWVSARGAWLLAGGITITAGFTASAGLGGLALSAGLWGYAARRSRVLLAAGLAGAALFFAAMLVSPVARDAGGMPFELRPPSRVLAWFSAWERTWEHPVFGRGVGTYAASVRNINAAGQEELVADAHNTWLNISAQQGIPGAVAFAAIFWVLLRGVGRLDVTSEGAVTVRTGLVIAVVGGFLYQSLSGSFEDARHMWVLFGLLAAVNEGAATR